MLIFVCNRIPLKRKKRNFTRWSAEDTQIVNQYFRSYVTNCSAGLPRKSEITEFKEKFVRITYDWTVIRTKVLNEQKAFEKRKVLKLQDMKAVKNA